MAKNDKAPPGTITLPREVYDLLLKRGERKGRNSKPLTIRLPNDIYAHLQEKATTKGTTIGIYVKDLVVQEGTRSHHKRPTGSN